MLVLQPGRGGDSAESGDRSRRRPKVTDSHGGSPMKRIVIRSFVLVCAGVLAFALGASADTLELKDGRVINGRYLGGTQSQVRLLVDGKVQLFPVDQIVA